MHHLKVNKVWIDSTHVYAEAESGQIACYAFADWPRLANASATQLCDFQLSHGGIHWPQIDEDLSFEGMFRDNGK